VVSLSVCLSVCLSVTIVSPAKNAEPIGMPFGLWTRVDQRNHEFEGVQIPPCEGTILRGEGAAHRKVYGRYAISCANTAEPITMSFWMWTRVGPNKHASDVGHVGATWRIRLNRPCAAAVRPLCRITLTTCCIISPSVSFFFCRWTLLRE